MGTGRAAVVERDDGKEIRWSVGRKADALMRLLRGEDLDELSRELRVEAHRLAAWREDFMAGDRRLEGPSPATRRASAEGGRAQDRGAHHGERDVEGGGSKKGAADPAQKRPR